MALSIDDMREWLAILRDHPEWKAEVRREVLSDELLSLPDLVRQNGEDIRALREVVAQNSADIQALKEVVAQNSADIQALKEVVAQNSADIQALKEVVAQNSADIQALKEVVAQNSADIRQNSVDIRALKEVVTTLANRIDNLVTVTTRLDGRLGGAEGLIAEARWAAKFTGRFGSLVNRARLISPDDLDAFSNAWDEGTLTDEDAAAVRALDLLIQGVEGRGDTRRPVVLAVEISIRLEQNDLDRVTHRAGILRNLGYHTIPVLAGSIMDPRLEAEARDRGVKVLLRPADLSSGH